MADEGEMRWVDAYDYANEQRPDLIPYQPAFKELNNTIAEAVDVLKVPLQKSLFQNVITESLAEETQFRTKECCSGEVTFAVVGDMASGKSSLINSILSGGMIARKVQRFMRTFEDQKSSFAARVYFFTSEEIRETLKSLIAKYHQAMGKGSSSDDEDDGEDDDEEDISEKNTVLETLMPLFCDQQEFETAESAIRFMDSVEGENDEAMLEQLATWADAVRDKHLKGDDFPYSCTVESEFGRGLTQPWPLVRMIDFGLDIPILNDGVILLDAPGTTDAHSIRAANAKAHHAKCSHKIYVAKVGRARDDKLLRKAMADTYKWRGNQNSILVLTHGEEIDDETIVLGTPMAKKMEKQLKDGIQDLRDRKAKLAVKLKMAISEERLSIRDELQTIRPELQRKLEEFDTCRLKMRNEHTKVSIQQKYRQLTTDPRPLPVYVVANDSYSAHRAGHFESDKPTLTVEETGVPALRTQLYRMPAEGKLNDTLHLAFHQLPRLINSFEMYCSRTYISRKSELEQLILHPKKQWPEIRQRTLERLREEVKRVVLQPMKENEDLWNRKARKYCREWGTTHYKKNLQLLKNDGYQMGRKKTDPDICWNSELLAINKESMEKWFKDLPAALHSCYEQMWKEVAATMETAKKNLRGDKEFHLMALDRLIKAFNQERPIAGKRVQKSLRNLENGTADVSEEATAGARTGYLAKVMAPVYSNVRQIKRCLGVVTKRIKEFERQVCKRSGVYMKIHDTIEDAFDKLFQKELADLGTRLENIFDGIHWSFNMMCEDTVPKSDIEKQQEAALIMRLNKALIKARELADGPVKTLALECKNYSAAKEENSLFVSKG